jgi:hypothetical protein
MMYRLYDDEDPLPCLPSVWVPFQKEIEPRPDAPGGARLNVDIMSSSSPEMAVRDGDSSSYQGDGDHVPDTEDTDADKLDPVKSWDVDAYVLCRPAPGASEDFWVGQIVPADLTDPMATDEKNIRVHWYNQRGADRWNLQPAYVRCETTPDVEDKVEENMVGEGEKHSGQHKSKRKRKRKRKSRRKSKRVTGAPPVLDVDWVSRDAVQGNVTLTKKCRLTKKSQDWITEWVLPHWAKNPLR